LLDSVIRISRQSKKVKM